jgi:hypothetical protein
LVLAACGGGGDDGRGSSGSFDDEVVDFRDTLCDVGSQCFSDDRQSCIDDVTADMADAKAELDDAGEMQCAACMHEKTVQAQAVLDADCNADAYDEEAVLAACDLTPDDGVDTDDEACAGYP